MRYDEILAFWFGDLDELGRADAAHASSWWRKDAAFDREVRERFLDDYERIAAGERSEWLATPRGRSLGSGCRRTTVDEHGFRGHPRIAMCHKCAIAAEEEAR